MTAAEIPETPEAEEVELHMIRAHSVRNDKGTPTPVALTLWLCDEGAGYLEILGAIGVRDAVDERIRGAAAWLTMDLQEIARAALRVERGESVRLVEASEWSSHVDRPQHLRDLAALASSAGDLFADAEGFGPAWMAYRDLAAALSERLTEEQEPKEEPPPLPTVEELGERAVARHLRDALRALDPETRDRVADLPAEELTRRLEAGMRGEGAR